MGWAIGEHNGRDIGYSVPAFCDHPKCTKQINRGLANVCGGEPYGGDRGCGLFFCGDHLYYASKRQSNGEIATYPYCRRCSTGKSPYTPKADHPAWVVWKLRHESWQAWRNDNPDEVVRMGRQVQCFLDVMDELAGVVR